MSSAEHISWLNFVRIVLRMFNQARRIAPSRVMLKNGHEIAMASFTSLNVAVWFVLVLCCTNVVISSAALVFRTYTLLAIQVLIEELLLPIDHLTFIPYLCTCGIPWTAGSTYMYLENNIAVQFPHISVLPEKGGFAASACLYHSTFCRVPFCSKCCHTFLPFVNQIVVICDSVCWGDLL